jgi:hypothetical protein
MSMPECRNDCEEPVWFPQRPWNRPGLSRIGYRVGTYADFREAFLRNLNREAVLSGWTHRSPDDPGIALLEGASILGDILTFYQELYANEAFLRTARWRVSIADLVRLLGYRLAPGLGGRGVFAFAVSGTAPVTVPKGFPLTAQVTGAEGQVDFETSEAIVAHPWLGRFNLFRPVANPYISSATSEFVVVSPDPFSSPVALQRGDRLLVGQPHPPSNPTRLIGAEIVVIDEVIQMHGQNRYRVRGSLIRLGAIPQLAAFKIGRSFRHFGHVAPPTTTTVSGGTADQTPISYRRRLDVVTAANVSPPLPSLHVPLDGKVDDLVAGVPLICQSVLRRSSEARTHVVMTLIRSIEEIRQNSYTWGAATGPATVAILDAALTTTTNPSVDTWTSASHTYDRLDIRDALFHETLSPQLTLRAAPEPTAATTGHDLYFLGTGAEVQALLGRKILLAKAGEDPKPVTVQSIEALSPDVAERPLLRRVTLDAVVSYSDFPHDAPAVAVYGNLAEATQGKTEHEAALGNGDSRQAFQTFKLPKSPLTYLTLPGEAPPEVPELDVYVANAKWTRVPTLFGRGPKDQVYIVREDDRGDSWVQFGDGKTGARLPSGVKNIAAIERTGQAAFGPLREGTKVQAAGRITRLDRVELPGVVSGGQPPERGDKAREAAPGKVQSLDRLVSLRDFETETLAIAGVSKASAAWELVDNIPAVVLTVLMQTGRDAELAQVQQVVATANRCRGADRFPVVVRPGAVRSVFVDVTVAIRPEVRAAVIGRAIKAALGVAGLEIDGTDGSRGLMAPMQRGFGEREYATRIEGVIQSLPGVLWVSVHGLGALGSADDASTLAPPDVPWPFSPVVPCDRDEILGLFAPHLDLTLTIPASAECT